MAHGSASHQACKVTWGWTAVLLVVLFVSATAVPIQAQTSGGTIEGTVVSVVGGEPIEGVSLLVDGGRFHVLSDRAGRYRVSGLPAGSLPVVVQRIGYQAVREQIAVPAGGRVNRTFELEEQPSLIEGVTVTASREAERIEAVPVAIGVVARERIRQIRPTDPGQVLNRVAGVHIVPFEDMATHNAVRQPMCCRATLLVTENGVPLSSPSFYRHSVINWVDLVQAERVEVLKGPGTAIYGSDAVTGVINVITALPPVAPSGDASAELGPYGYLRGTASAGGTFGIHGLRLDATIATSDGRRENPMDRQDVALRWTAALPNGAHFQTSVAFNNVEGIGNDDQTPDEFRDRSTFSSRTWARAFTFHLRHRTSSSTCAWRRTVT